MKKKESKNISGLTLIEILIGVVMSTLMMAAIFTTYQVVSNSYSQVTDRAKISRSGRDIVSMLMRDIRLAGYKYYLGKATNCVTTGEDTTCEMNNPNEEDISISDDLIFKGGTVEFVQESHDPLIIVKNKLGYLTDKNEDVKNHETKNASEDMCCDRIHIVYGDFDADDSDQPYKRYRITYFAKKSADDRHKYYAVYKTKESWQQNKENPGSWITSGCAECYEEELIRDHLVDMEFIAFDREGKVIIPPPHPNKDSRVDLYNIKTVDVRLTFRSKQEFFRYRAPKGTPRLVKGMADRTREFFDRFLRDSVAVTVHTRNIGL